MGGGKEPDGESKPGANDRLIESRVEARPVELPERDLLPALDVLAELMRDVADPPPSQRGC